MLTADEYREYGVGHDYGDSVDWWDELINDGNFSQKHSFSVEWEPKMHKFILLSFMRTTKV